MQAFQVSLRPSASAKRLTIAAHLAAVALCWRYFNGMAQWAGYTVLLISLIDAWRYHKRLQNGNWRKIIIDTGGHVRIKCGNNQEYDAVLLGSSLIHRYACFLCIEYEKGKSWLTVLPDMTDAESYRRLLVWSRFGRPKADKNRPEV